MRITNELKVGAVIMVALIMCVMLFVKTEGVKTKTYDLKTSFRYGANLKPNAIVKLTGIEVGRVKEITLSYAPDTAVDCVLEIDVTAKARKDSIAYIDTAGIVGDSYVGLTSGVSSEFCADGDTIASEEPIQTRLLMQKADEIATSMDEIFNELERLLGDNKETFQEIIANLADTAENFDEFSQDLKEHPWKLMYKGD